MQLELIRDYYITFKKFQQFNLYIFLIFLIYITSQLNVKIWCKLLYIYNIKY